MPVLRRSLGFRWMFSMSAIFEQRPLLPPEPRGRRRGRGAAGLRRGASGAPGNDPNRRRLAHDDRWMTVRLDRARRFRGARRRSRAADACWASVDRRRLRSGRAALRRRIGDQRAQAPKRWTFSISFLKCNHEVVKDESTKRPDLFFGFRVFSEFLLRGCTYAAVAARSPAFARARVRWRRATSRRTNHGSPWLAFRRGGRCADHGRKTFSLKKSRTSVAPAVRGSCARRTS